MKARTLLLSLAIPLVLALLASWALIGGGKAGFGGWLRTIAAFVLPAVAAHGFCVWLLALRAGAAPVRGAAAALAKAAGTGVLSLLLYFVLMIFWLPVNGLGFGETFGIAAVAATIAAIFGFLPGVLLQWAVFHFTLPRATE